MKHRFPVFLLLLSTLALLSGCDTKRKTLVQMSNEQQILHVGNGDEISSIDPHVITGMPEFHVVLNLYEGLVTKNPKTLAIEPGVADSWDVSADGLTYNFHIRENAKWSNGEKLVAQDFVQSWLRALMPGLGNEYATSYFVIKNAKEIYEQNLTPDKFGAVALDDSHLQVQLVSPTPYFLQLLDHSSMYPVHIKTIQKFGGLDERGTRWTRAENFVGNGAFVLKEWTPNKYLSISKSPTYWGASDVRLNEVRFYPIQKSSTEERMFRSGQLHTIDQLPRDKLPSYKQINSPALRSFSVYGTYFYRFNTNVKPLDDVRVRKALAYSIDRAKIVDHVTKFGQPLAYTLTPPDTLGYVPQAKMPYDIALAKKLLAEAGYPNGAGFPVLKLAFNTSDEHQHIAAAVQQMWKEHLGINITLENMEWKVFLDAERQMDFQIHRSSWYGDYVDPNTFLELFISQSGNNRTGFANAEYDRLIASAGAEVNKEKRLNYFQAAEQILVDEVPILPFYTYHRYRLVSPSVHGWHDNPMEHRPLKSIYLEP